MAISHIVHTLSPNGPQWKGKISYTAPSYPGSLGIAHLDTQLNATNKPYTATRHIFPSSLITLRYFSHSSAISKHLNGQKPQNLFFFIHFFL